MSSAGKIAIILGAGPGTGAGIARAFAATHSLALLARKRATLESTLASLPQGTNAKAIEADASNSDSIISAFKTVKDTWPHAEIDVAVFNPGGIFKPGPFLDADIADLRANLESGVIGAFTFAKCFLSDTLDSKKTLIFTGATMSVRGSAGFGTMAPSKFALRALSQSLAREFGGKKVHVAHAIIDGIIDTERVTGMMGESKAEGERLSPDSIGKAYLSLHEQDESAWTHELDLRPMKEKW